MTDRKPFSFGVVHVCQFDSDLPKSKHGNSERVLEEVLAGRGRFSAFEMTQKLWNTLKGLERKGYIREIKKGYPTILFVPAPREGGRHE